MSRKVTSFFFFLSSRGAGDVHGEELKGSSSVKHGAILCLPVFFGGVLKNDFPLWQNPKSLFRKHPEPSPIAEGFFGWLQTSNFTYIFTDLKLNTVMLFYLLQCPGSFFCGKLMTYGLLLILLPKRNPAGDSEAATWTWASVSAHTREGPTKSHSPCRAPAPEVSSQE